MSHFGMKKCGFEKKNKSLPTRTGSGVSDSLFSTK